MDELPDVLERTRALAASLGLDLRLPCPEPPDVCRGCAAYRRRF